MRIRLGLAAVFLLASCASESDGRNVVMVPPDESAGAEETGLADRPQSVTIGGGAGAQTQTSDWQVEAGQLYDEAAMRSDQLSNALSSDRCNEAGDLRDRICELATRICDIAEEHPLDEPTTQRCADAEARCARAGERVAERCDY